LSEWRVWLEGYNRRACGIDVIGATDSSTEDIILVAMLIVVIVIVVVVVCVDRPYGMSYSQRPHFEATEPIERSRASSLAEKEVAPYKNQVSMAGIDYNDVHPPSLMFSIALGLLQCLSAFVLSPNTGTSPLLPSLAGQGCRLVEVAWESIT
jgi:hypothetical protein